MNRTLMWRVVLVLGVTALSCFLAFPMREKVRLGLDLQGGIHLRLQVETQDAVRAESQAAIERVVRSLNEAGVPGAQGELQGIDSFVITGAPAAQDAVIDRLLRNSLPEWSSTRRGDEVVFQLDAASRRQTEELAVTQALQTITNRVDEFGVAEPVITREGVGGNRLAVQLPGVDDPERVKDLIQNTAFLEFRLVRAPAPDQPQAASEEELLGHFGGQLPAGVEVLPSRVRGEQGQTLGTTYYAVEVQPVITGRDLRTARPALGQFNEPVVNFSLTHDGGQRFARATEANIGRGLAIVLDGNIVSAPRINSRIGDSGLIEGRFTQQEAEDLSTVLRSGALPAGITYLEERTVGPSLGQDSIREGLRAGIIGAALVVAAMLVIYMFSGLNAIIALGLNIIMVFAALAYFGGTLTLPGIAGIVLTLGMSVDANVLVFERIREELRAGRTVRAAIDAGFQKAMSSIMDGNVTSLIAALFLFQFGTGPVRGFAVTLAVGILASLFTAVFVSRTLFELVLTARRRADRLSI